ncbi:MAG: dihydroorotase [Candidatus Omnitrophota bacterium]|nr:dihydroorotase [Candidatus Omnitrophota bacterium]MBU1928257.1 dihydroorotase [Candidatus Omnitrophota bacterium]MBU2034767.1 dihydroorotase [Candidatus Omnitrophota bacterium]MBU2222233.1 dihydroorotase [Candidatus Omnitrophota bacterium]MBU2258926.1 dihydroorotase [Candidatus Omnitrophota bacterium]
MNAGKTILIKNGRVIDPANNIDDTLHILVENGRVSKIGKNIKSEAQDIIDATDKIVMPGLVDMHVHLREPGREDKETIESGTKAALKGGVTTVLAMPNTLPAIDSPETAGLLKNIIRKTAMANVLMSGAITKARLGKELTDIAALKKQGVTAISDDGSSVDDPKLMLEAFKKAKQNKVLVCCHCEDKNLSQNGVVNLGFTSTKMGLRGISRESEYKRIERDIQLADKAKCPLHVCHVSCRESVEIIARAKRKGIKVTCETAPHYFSLSEEEVWGYDTNMKMNPPLRSKEDVESIRLGLKKGTIDAIASDHAPHTENDKDIEFERAEFGIIGLETELAVSITELVKTGLLDWSGLVRKNSFNPARILGLNKGNLGVNKDADIVIVDPDKKWIVSRETVVSKSKNSPFVGRELTGAVEYTIYSGEVVYRSAK